MQEVAQYIIQTSSSEFLEIYKDYLRDFFICV
jgi:hypothetical protein